MVQRVQNKLLKRLDFLNHGGKAPLMTPGARPSTENPFAAPSQRALPVPASFADSVAEVGGVRGVTPAPPMQMSDLTFEPSLQYKKV